MLRSLRRVQQSGVGQPVDLTIRQGLLKHLHTVVSDRCVSERKPVKCRQTTEMLEAVAADFRIAQVQALEIR